MEAFMSHSWEGNVRELENLIEGIMNLHDTNIIDLEHLPQKILRNANTKTNQDNKSLREILEQTEKELIQEALRKTDNNITHAADLLQLPRQTLQYRIQKLKISE